MSAQSWEGLGDTEDERRRVAGTAEGGIWLLRVPRPEPVAELAGSRPVTDTSRRLSAPGTWEPEGSSRTRLAPVLDGDLVRRLDVGQAAYVYRGGVTYVQVKRLTGRQAALAPANAAAAEAAAAPDRADGAADVSADVPADVSADGRATAVPVSGLPAAGFPATGFPVTGFPTTGAVAARVPAQRAAAGTGEPQPDRLPDVSEVLDEAFGARHE